MLYELMMRGPAVACFCSLFVLLGAMPKTVSAQAPQGGGVVFSWVRSEGAESCPGRPDLAMEVARRLGYDPFEPPFGQALEGVVRRSEGRWTVLLYSRDMQGAQLGQRELASEAADCAALADAVALTIALAIDPDAALRAPAPTPATPNSEIQPAEPEPPPAPPAADPETHDAGEARELLRLSVGPIGSYDLVPTFGIGARLGVDGPILPELRWYGAVVYWPEQLSTLGDASFGIGLTTFSIGLCAGTQLDWVRFDGCASVDVGGTYVVVYSPTPQAPGERFWASATALFRVEARIFSPLWIGLFAGITVPFIRYDYRVQGRTEVVFSPSPVAPLAGLEIALHFR